MVRMLETFGVDYPSRYLVKDVDPGCSMSEIPGASKVKARAQ
jgi:hypothetical protein